MQLFGNNFDLVKFEVNPKIHGSDVNYDIHIYLHFWCTYLSLFKKILSFGTKQIIERTDGQAGIRVEIEI